MMEEYAMSKKPKRPDRGWFIKMKEPNNLFWSLSTDNNYTELPEQALLFARRQDAEAYFNAAFHPSAQINFQIGGLH